MTFYSATCPGCGADVVGTLDAEPDVPIYRCGAWGRGRTCPARWRGPVVARLEPADVVGLALTVDALVARLERDLGDDWTIDRTPDGVVIQRARP